MFCMRFMIFHMYCYGDEHVCFCQIILLINQLFYYLFWKILQSYLDLHRDNIGLPIIACLEFCV